MPSIIPYVNDYLQEKSEEIRDYGEYWSASQAGYCMRLNILKRLKVPAVPEVEDARPRVQGTFEVGHAMHAVLQNITKTNGLSIASEEELLDDDLMIKGHFDDLLRFQFNENGEPCVGDDEPRATTYVLYDYKSANSLSFNFPKPVMGHYHMSQLRTYLYEVNKSKKYPTVLEGRILTVDRDNFRMKEHTTHWDSQAEKEIVGYWKTINGYWKKKTLPACTCLDHDGGFMGRRSKKGKVYNDFYFNDEPCSLAWVEQFPEIMKGWKI